MEETKALPTYFCRNCVNPLALGEDIISKRFKVLSGDAIMFSHAMNVVMTGRYIVADVKCSKCGESVGWKYVQTFDMRQRFKEGMFVLEDLKMTKKY